MSVKTFASGALVGGTLSVLAALGIHGKADIPTVPIVIVSPTPNSVRADDYQCPDLTWTRVPGFIADVGGTYVTCTKNKVVLRHFDRVPVGNNQDQALDQGVYPFEEIPSVDAAIKIANSR